MRAAFRILLLVLIVVAALWGFSIRLEGSSGPAGTHFQGGMGASDPWLQLEWGPDSSLVMIQPTWSLGAVVAFCLLIGIYRWAIKKAPSTPS